MSRTLNRHQQPKRFLPRSHRVGSQFKIANLFSLINTVKTFEKFKVNPNFIRKNAEKFDDLLRMVVSTSKEQTFKLKSYLENEFKKGEIIYGLHKSDAALMTCLIFERHGKHAHFVDSSNGGYAVAAKEFKERNFINKSEN